VKGLLFMPRQAEKEGSWGGTKRQCNSPLPELGVLGLIYSFINSLVLLVDKAWLLVEGWGWGLAGQVRC
jgi:hypothetical protein